MLLKEILFFILPLLLTGLVHHLFVIRLNLLPSLARPIDNGFRMGNNYLFGPSKTWRGIVVVVFLSGIFYYLLSFFIEVGFRGSIFMLGSLLGLGYALGELPNSFVKRRLGIVASDSNYQGLNKFFYFIDQIDSVLGAILFLYFIYDASFILMVAILGLGSLAHFIIDRALHLYSYKRYKR